MNGVGAEGGVAERLYYDSAELTFAARVTDVRLLAQEHTATGERSQLWQVALDRTAFYPESGGQPWDTGVLIARARSGAVLEVAVERVDEDAAGEVWHTVRKPLVEGTAVEGRVDAQWRLDHTQQHTGQHLLSAVFLAELGASTVSFHLGAEVCTIDLRMEEGGALTAEQLRRVELSTNELIAAGRAVAVSWHTRGEAEAMLAQGMLRKLPDRSGPLRVVEIEGVEWNACGGTHVGSTAGIGVVLLRGAEKFKQGWRVSFVCGLRALQAARRDGDLLQATARQLSVGAEDVPARVASLQAENKAAAKGREELLEELADLFLATLLRDSTKGEVIRAEIQAKPAAFAGRVALKLAAAGRTALVSVRNGADASVHLSVPQGSPYHAGNLVRGVAERFGLRGGGSPQTAQMVCPAAQLAEVIARLSQELR